MESDENPRGTRTTRRSRRISLRTTGRTNGQLTRLAGPSDIAQLSTPFVLLDRFVLGDAPLRLPMHPHSGIAVVTYLLQGSLSTIERSGAQRTLSPGAVEWSQCGRGAWNAGSAFTRGAVSGYRLWIALPPSLELGEPDHLVAMDDEVLSRGPARVLLGKYDGELSPLQSPVDMTYLHVDLKARDQWRYEPPASHDILWIAVHSGSLYAGGELLEAGEFVLFDQSGHGVDIVAHDTCTFMLGSAEQSPHEVVDGYFSVHADSSE